MAPTPHRSGGATRFEFAVVVIVISLLALPLAAALVRYQGIAERQRVDLTIRDMQTCLRLKMLDLMVNGRQAEIRALAGANPVVLMEFQPKGYLGEFTQKPAFKAGGVWYFDQLRRELIYYPASISFPYQTGEGGALRWQLQSASHTEMSVRLVALTRNNVPKSP